MGFNFQKLPVNTLIGADWKPDTDENDAMLERICTRIEQGTL